MRLRGEKPAIALLTFLLTSLLIISACQQSSTTPAPGTGTTANQPTSTANYSTTSAPASSKPTTTPSPGSQVKATPPSNTQAAAATVRFKTFSLVDQQGTGIEALKILVPADWQTEGSIQWTLDCTVMPATASLRIWNPGGSEVFEGFPSQAFFWTDNQLTLQINPIGSRYFGAEVHPLVEPEEALQTIVLPRLRGDVANLKIISEQPVEISNAPGQQPGLPTSSKAAKVRVEYEQNGVNMEEEIACEVDALYIPSQGLGGTTTNIFWNVSSISSFKAEKGKLDAGAKIFQTVLYSLRPNPLWFSKYNQVVEYLIQNQIQRIQSLGELSRIISQTSNEISDSMMQSYNERQAINDKIADNFSQYIRGVDSYYDPIEQKPVELPAGYENAWTNSLGEYILTESPSFNPNIGSNLNWQSMKKQP